MLRPLLRPLLAILAATLSIGPVQAQKLNDKTKPRNHPVNCPYTGGDPELLAKVGIVSISGFDFGLEESTQGMDAFLITSDLRWVETEHFKIGYALGSYKIPQKEKHKIMSELERLAVHWPTIVPKKVRTLDPWLRTYIFALRVEDLWDEMLDLLDVKEDDFPDGSEPWDTLTKYMGVGPYLGEKGKYEILMLPSATGSREYLRHYFGLLTRRSQRWNIIEKDVLHLVIHTEQGDLRKDTALHGHLVFNMSQQMLNGYKHYSYEIPVWIKEGIGHWLERKISPDYNTFNSSEGAVAEMTRKTNWEPPTRLLVQRREFPGMARLMNVRGFAELKLEHHYTTWSMVDFLTRAHPEFLPALLDRIKGMTNELFIDDATGLNDVHRAAFKELLGLSYAQFDRAWAAWVQEHYGTK